MRNRSTDLQKRLLSLVLSLVIVMVAIIPMPVSGYDYAHNDFTDSALLTDDVAEIVEEINKLRGMGGLIGFEGDYALADSDELTRVIVLFNHSPAATQVAEASLLGDSLSMEQAESLVESDHEMFRSELANLLGFNRATSDDDVALGILREYRSALNGVAITIPAYAVPLVAEFDSVFAVYPDEMFFIDPIVAANDDDGNETNDALNEDNTEEEVNINSDDNDNWNPPDIGNAITGVSNTNRSTEVADFTMPAFGNSVNRLNSGANLIHEMGFRGEGILVGILDSGIDYYHPAFAGAFLTLEQAHARGMTHITEDDLINGFFYGRNYVDEAQFNVDGFNLGIYLTANNRVVDPRDPMETRYDRWVNTGLNRLSRQFWTDHGTHVAGTIAARPVAHHFNGGAMGFAPEAQIFMYRVMGPTGVGFVADILAGINQTAYDRPDIVNMSIGGASNAANDLQAIAVNNISLAHDIVFVIAAGNSGDGMHTVGRPATASTAISVAATLEPRTTTLIGNISGDIQNRTFTSRSQLGGSLLAFNPGTTAALWHQPPGASHFETTLHPANPDGSYNLVRLPYHPASPNDPQWVHAGVDPENYLGTGFFLEWLQLAGITDFEYPSAIEMADWFTANMDKSFNIDFDISTLRSFLKSMLLYVNSYNSFLSDGSSSGVGGIINERRELLGGDDAVFAHYVYNSFMRVHSSATAGPQVAIRAAYAEATGTTFPNNTIPPGHHFYTWLMPYLEETFGDDLDAFLDELDFGRQLVTAHDFWHYTQRVGMLEFERQTFMELVPEEQFGFLEGAFVVLGSVNLAGINMGIMTNNVEFATRLGAAGIISLGRDSTINRDIHTTIPYIGHGTSANVAPIINSLTDECTITFTARNQDLRAVTPFSSRGPVGGSYEIKPDISAHGFGVVSPVPAFFGNAAADPYWNAYAPNSGTSMAAPGIAGQVALMREYSNYHDLGWDAGAIKSRLMNTAEPTGVRTSALLGLAWSAHNSNPSVFEIGAGYARVDRAIMADTFATATFDRVYLHPDSTMGTTFTGSLSFGGVNTWNREGSISEAITRTMTVTVYNASESPVSYSIDVRRNAANRVGITNNWPAGVAVTLETNQITVPPLSSETFAVTLSIPPREVNAARLQLEGWVELRREGSLEISMPFAGIVENVAPHLTDHSLVRDVITTGESRFHDFSSSIDMRYTAWRPTIGPAFLFDINNFDPHNWAVDAIIGYFGPLHHSLPGEQLGVERFINASRGQMGRWVGDFLVIGQPIVTIPPGNYAFAWENRQATGTAANPTIGPWSYSEYFNLTVNNTPPEITIDSKERNIAGEVVIIGRVTDALDRGYNALFALASITDDLEEGTYAKRVPLEADGSFTLTTAAATQLLRLYAVDEYLPVPQTLIEGGSNFPISLEQSADGLSYYIGNNVIVMDINLYSLPHPLTISRLSINGIEGIIDQEAATIRFQVPNHLLTNDRLHGNITELEADCDTVYFWVAGVEWPRRQGEAAGFGTGDLVYVADGRIYTLMIEAPEELGLINHLRIGSVTGMINQEAATITFAVPRHLMVNNEFRGVITQLSADQDTLLFFVAGQEWPVSLGQMAGINDGDLVYVAGGRVYTIRLVIR